MKRWLLAALIAVMALCAQSAIAETDAGYDTPVNPYFARVNRAHTRASAEGPELRRGGSDLSVRLERSGDDFFGEGVSWRAKATGGAGGYRYEFYLCEYDDTFGSSNVHGYQKASGNDVFEYRFMVNGEYYLYCAVTDASGAMTVEIEDVTVNERGRSKVGDLVRGVLDECRGADDYETALNVHDWLTRNARYDYSYTYYSADGVLARGAGVCDSYSKAYYLILREAGIDVDRVTNNGHSWNIVKLDGEWYHVDATWDDPGASDGPVSGNEGHMYFGLTDELISTDHDAYTASHPCVALADNYFIRSGRVSLWLDDFIGQTEADLAEYAYYGVMSAPEPYASEKGGGWLSQGRAPIVYGLVAYALTQREWPVDGRAVHICARYDDGLRMIKTRVDIPPYQTLTLPAGLLTVDEEAFMGAASPMAVILPDGARAIGANAFSGLSDLWKVVIPASVTRIDPTAFEGCDHAVIFCVDGSAAQTFAYEQSFNATDLTSDEDF